MQLRRLAALERQRIVDQLAEYERIIADLTDILARPERQRKIISDELTEIVEKYGDERRTRIIAADGDLSNEDLIPDSDVVVTITRGGYAKRTNTDLYRVQKRGGKGVRGATLRTDDEVEHLFVTTNHHWILFFTNKGRVYRAKVWQLPEAGRDARGGHVAGLLSFMPDEVIAQVLAIRDYSAAPYLLLASKRGLVKKTALPAYDSPRQAGIIAVNFREEDDELIGAELCSADDEVLLISRKGLSIRFPADDYELRPMGRATSGVTGMKFRPGDELLSMSVIRAGASDDERFVFTVTDGGFAKRTHVVEYRQQGRGGLGIKAMKLNEDRGSLVGGLVVTDNDEVIAIKASGQITRSAVAEVPVKGRDTMGVRFVGVAENDSVVVIALNPETTAEAAQLADEAPAGDDSNSTSGVVEDDSSLEPGLEVRPVTPNGGSDDAVVQEDDSE
jgi:DNA gyrase subunit A